MCLRHDTTPVKLQKRKKNNCDISTPNMVVNVYRAMQCQQRKLGYFSEIQITHLRIYIKGPVTA